MSPVKREWLVHGCMRLSDYDRVGRVSLKVRHLIEGMYASPEFRIRQWPQRDFRHTLWWYEKQVEVPGLAASYFLKLDNQRGPNLYAGITVEKAYEDDDLARKAAAENDQPFEWWILDKRWDWHRFVSSLPHIKPLVLSVAETLHSELYVWLEFAEEETRETRYYLVTPDDVYWRGGFKPIDWNELENFVAQPRLRSWGDVFVAKAFTLDECTPHLDESELLDVFGAMQPIRDTWRGLSSGSTTR